MNISIYLFLSSIVECLNRLGASLFLILHSNYAAKLTIRLLISFNYFCYILGPFIQTAANFPISKLFQCSKFSSLPILHEESFFSFKQQHTWMTKRNFWNHNVCFPPKYQAFKFRNIKVCCEIEKLENRFSKFWKIGKEIFQKLEFPKNCKADKWMSEINHLLEHY